MSASTETIQAPQARENGLATYFQVLIAPGEAFAKLARTPMWGWAAIVGIILTVAGALIGMSATQHLIHVSQEQALSQMSADQAAAAREAYSKIPNAVYAVGGIIGSIVVPWLIWLVYALVYLIGAAIGGGEPRFKNAWVASVNLYIIPAIGAVISYAIVAFRGPESVNTATDLYTLPSLAMLVHGSKVLEAVLYAYNIVNIWLYLVVVIALERMLKLDRTPAIATVVIVSLVGAGLAALGALFSK